MSCEVASKDSFTELKPLQSQIESMVGEAQKNKEIIKGSVYLRLLNSGRWLGINEDDKYTPASLMKVLIMIGYLKFAETDSLVLSQSLIYNGPRDKIERIEDQIIHNLKKGREYTIEELIRVMIQYSDNEAMYMLVDNLTQGIFRTLREIYSDLNIPFSDSLNEKDLENMSVKTYSMIFRVLYGSTYLNLEMSNKALQLLSKTDFDEGIIEGVKGTNLLVAHKFGSRTVPAQNGSAIQKELHDCGIVYYPQHPYLLCVMTKGDNYSTLEKLIQRISLTAYQGVSVLFK